ncbi:MAG TPA: hypothetical protein VN611_07970 [Patescibacteria group bacterium]|nr:hypothetical protein [Patescibacteria group bacterium]
MKSEAAMAECKRAGGSGGFMVVEVLLVLSVASMLAVVAMPVLGNVLARQEIDMAARQLAADVRWLQQISINGSGSVMPQLEFTERGYMITQGTQSRKTVIFPSTVTGYFPRMVFGINGTLAVPNSLGATIRLNSKRITGASRQVIIDAVGRVRVE